MKPLAVILIGIMILAEASSNAMSQEPFDMKNMTCNIKPADKNGCTGIPTLQTGELVFSKDGTFVLKALYQGCFISENVTKSGKYQASHFKKTMRIELLTTKTTGNKNQIPDFPRTLGFANLNNNNLAGYFIDISALIRERGRQTENIITLKLQCELNE